MKLLACASLFSLLRLGCFFKLRHVVKITTVIHQVIGKIISIHKKAYEERSVINYVSEDTLKIYV